MLAGGDGAAGIFEGESPATSCAAAAPENFTSSQSQAEKAELASLKENPEEVDADAESRARLRALRGEHVPAPKAVDLPFRTAQVMRCQDTFCGYLAVVASRSRLDKVHT